MGTVTVEERQMLQQVAAAGGRLSFSRTEHQQSAMRRFIEIARSLEHMGLARTGPFELLGIVHLVPVEITDAGRRMLQTEASQA